MPGLLHARCPQQSHPAAADSERVRQVRMGELGEVEATCELGRVDIDNLGQAPLLHSHGARVKEGIYASDMEDKFKNGRTHLSPKTMPSGKRIPQHTDWRTMWTQISVPAGSDKSTDVAWCE